MPVFRSNNRFTITRGAEFFRDGEVCFPIPTDPTKVIVDMSYRSLLGPTVAMDVQIYCNCDACMSCALRRLTACKEPTKLRISYLPPTAREEEFIADYDDLLRRNQNRNVRNFFKDIDMISLLYTTSDLDVFDTIEEAARLHHGDPHVKRLLRMGAWRELTESGDRHRRLWLTKVLYKFKKDEIAKPLKKPRSIGDLGVAASLQGFIVTSLLKKAMMRHPLSFNGVTAEFIGSPETDTLKSSFGQLLNPDGLGYFCYFSDDSCFSFRHNGILRYYNVDISGCDSSHGSVIFEALIRLAPEPLRDAFRVLVEQCELDITIRSQHDKKNKVRGRFDGPTLFSGSTITTVINNLANILIFLVLSRTVAGFGDEPMEDDEICRIFTLALEDIGYVVTGFAQDDKCRRPQDLQFLKHSPALSLAGVFEPVLNAGVWFRSTGTAHGDVPGSSKLYTIQQRAASMQLSLLRGMFPRTTSPFLRNVRDSAAKHAHPKLILACDAIVKKDLEYKVVCDPRAPTEFSDEELFSRYSFTPLDFAELLEFSFAGLYDHTCGEFASKSLVKDYGFGTLTWEEKMRRDGLW
jgi:hypothetical protein